MAKYCGNCGAKFDDSAKICGYCGTPLGEPAPNTSAPKKSGKTKLIAIVAAIAVVVIGIICIASGSSNYKSAVKKIMNAYMNKDSEAMAELCTGLYDKIEGGDYVKKIVVAAAIDHSEFEDEFEEYKLSYKITEVEDVDKDEIKDMNEELEEEYDLGKNYIKAAKTVKVTVTAKHGKEKVEKEISINLIKEKGGWKLYSIG